MNWMQVERYLDHDDRAVLPLGSTEQHSHLRLTVDCILPERVGAEAAEPLGIPVFPVVAVRRDALLPRVPGLRSRCASIRISASCATFSTAWRTAGSSGSSSSTATAGTAPCSSGFPSGPPTIPIAACSFTTGGTRRARGPRCSRSIRSRRTGRGWRTFRGRDCPASTCRRCSGRWSTSREFARSTRSSLRAYIGDGNYGGLYQRSDEDMLALWKVAVDETRALLTGSWGDAG